MLHQESNLQINSQALTDVADPLSPGGSNSLCVRWARVQIPSHTRVTVPIAVLNVSSSVETPINLDLWQQYNDEFKTIRRF